MPRFTLFAITPTATEALASIKLAKLNPSCAELGPTQPQLVVFNDKTLIFGSKSWTHFFLILKPLT